MIAFIDRLWNLIFFPNYCLRIPTKLGVEYNVITEFNGLKVRSLGNDLFKILSVKPTDADRLGGM